MMPRQKVVPFSDQRNRKEHPSRYFRPACGEMVDPQVMIIVTIELPCKAKTQFRHRFPGFKLIELCSVYN